MVVHLVLNALFAQSICDLFTHVISGASPVPALLAVCKISLEDTAAVFGNDTDTCPLDMFVADPGFSGSILGTSNSTSWIVGADKLEELAIP